LVGAGVEQVAGCVAGVHGVVDPVHFSLD
jgi:hypothetical protein